MYEAVQDSELTDFEIASELEALENLADADAMVLSGTPMSKQSEESDAGAEAAECAVQ